MAEPERSVTRVGLLADPDSPQWVAGKLADTLPDQLADSRGWKAEFAVEVDPVTAGRQDTAEILRAAGERRDQRDWDYAICLTDLPVRRQHRPILAEANLDERLAVVCLPALGGIQPYRRAQQIVLQVLDEFTEPDSQMADSRGSSRRGLASHLTELLAPIYREYFSGDGGEVDVRFSATKTRGRIRLLTGMVRTNRPWRLVFGLSRALAAAVATSVFGLSSSTIWQIGDQLSLVSHIAAVAAAVVALVFWLIAGHHLWEKRQSDTPRDREQVFLYNASTVLSLTVGVGCLYAILFLINSGLAAFLVPSTLLSSTVGHPAEWTSYLTLAWAFTTMGAIAGALGSSLETDQAVRQAAYGYREEQRRLAHEHQRTANQD